MKARIGCILLILLSLPGYAGAQGKPEKEKIRIGYAARVVAHFIPYLAAQAGLFPVRRACR
jgi:ABC-type nitrate/sulfonate/bicarbonate transport system substrate-binding protein